MSPSTARLLGSIAAGAVTGSVLSVVTSWQLAVLAAWIAAAVLYLVLVWSLIWPADGAETERASTREDDSRTARGVIILTSSLVSLAGAAIGLHKATQFDGGAEPVLLTGSAIVAVVVSWLAVHTDFTLRYAHVYYTPPVGGLQLAGDDRPDYRDFAYLAFTVGMTYQVSDTALLTPRFRRVLLVHALLSYVFGAVIVAAVINIVAGLVN
jgi:uncharacterized membrane protein